MSAATEQSFGARVLLICSGLLIWGVHFLAVYVFAALACARGFADMSVAGWGIVPLAIALATGAALLALVGLTVWAWRNESRAGANGRQTHGFLRYLAVALALYSGVAIILQAVPTLVLPVCA